MIALAVCAGRSAAQDSARVRARRDTTLQAYRYRLLGVYDAQSGLPVEDAEVVDILSGVSARTTKTGTVSLYFLPDGGSLVRIRKVGYAMQTMMAAISPADTMPITVVLTPAVMLPGVTTYAASSAISSNLRGFEDRRRSGLGYYMDEAELRKDDMLTLGDALVSHMPGIHIVPGPYSSMYLASSPRCLYGKPPDVYLDNVRVVPEPQSRAPGAGTVNLSMFYVSSLAAVEYYPDNNVAPPPYGGTSKGCGVLLLWTRAR